MDKYICLLFVTFNITNAVVIIPQLQKKKCKKLWEIIDDNYKPEKRQYLTGIFLLYYFFAPCFHVISFINSFFFCNNLAQPSHSLFS